MFSIQIVTICDDEAVVVIRNGEFARALELTFSHRNVKRQMSERASNIVS